MVTSDPVSAVKAQVTSWPVTRAGGFTSWSLSLLACEVGLEWARLGELFQAHTKQDRKSAQHIGGVAQSLRADLGSQPKACSLLCERLQTTRLVLGTHLGSRATSSNTRKATWLGGRQHGSRISQASAGRSRVYPMEELASSRCPGEQGRMVQGPLLAGGGT